MAKYSAHERWKRHQAKLARRRKRGSSKLNSLDYSKRARGQSKREYAAQQLGGTLNYKKGSITVRKKVPNKTVTNKIYAGPSRMGEVKPGYYNPYTQQVQTLTKSDYLTDSNAYEKKQRAAESLRQKRQKAAKASGGGYSKATNALGGKSFLEASKEYNATNGSGANLGQNTVSTKGGVVGTSAPWREYLRKGTNLLKHIPGVKIASKEAKALGFDLTDYLGIPKAQAMEFNVGDTPINNPTAPDKVTGYGAGDMQYFNGYIPKDENGNVLKDYRPAPQGQPDISTQPMSTPDIFSQSNNRPSPTSIGAIYSGQDQNASLAPQDDQTYQPPVDTAPNLPTPVADTTPVQSDLGGTARHITSTGAFGNGALLSNNGYDQATKDYIKKLQGSAKGDFGMSDAKKQIENLLNSLNSRYGEYKRTGTNELDKAKQEDLKRLASLFTAYNTSDSEQRMQQQERTQNDYQNRLADLLAKLDAQKSQDITNVQNKGLDAYSQIRQSQQSAQDKVAQLIYQAQQNAQNRNYQMQKDAYARQQAAQARNNRKAKLPSFAMAAQQLGARPGANWGAIADALSKNYPLYPGSENSQILDAIMTGQAPQKQQKLSLTPYKWDEYGKPVQWIDQNTGNIIAR